MEFKGNIDSCSTFWQAGENCWRSMIDGEYQNYGMLVFDQGLHNANQVEPGYFKSIDAAYSYLMPEIINRDNIKDIYLRVHKIACRHFDVSLNCAILMNAQEAGKLRTYEIPEEEEKIGCYIPLSYIESTNPIHELGLINEEIATLSAELGLKKPLASLSIAKNNPTLIYVDYNILSSDIPMTLEKIFARFYEKMENATSSDEKVTVIAELYQALEWLHPFKDGQGRTDGVFLNKFLCDYQQNPCILQKPYFSTANRLEAWKNYLVKGMDVWKSEICQVKVDMDEIVETHHEKVIKIFNSDLTEDKRLATLHNFEYIQGARSKFKALMFKSIRENKQWDLVRIVDIFYSTFPLIIPFEDLDAEVNQIAEKLSYDARHNLQDVIKHFKSSQPNFNSHWY